MIAIVSDCLAGRFVTIVTMLWGTLFFSLITAVLAVRIDFSADEYRVMRFLYKEVFKIGKQEAVRSKFVPCAD